MRGTIKSLIGLAALLFAAVWTAQGQDALESYVAEPDPAYGFRRAEVFPNLDYTLHVLELTSQNWRTEAEVDRPLWKHWITIIVPRRVETTTALLVLGGGFNVERPPLAADRDLVEIARSTNAVVAEVGMIPNQPLTFRGEELPRTEDWLIAYGWAKYLETGDAKWLPRLPMTKAAVRAMDAITDYLGKQGGGGHTVESYVVTGASKRGWTGWTTAAVDKRVVGLIPVVTDVLNFEVSMIHHYRAYGGWAPAVHDYERMGVMKMVGSDELRSLAREVDPYSFRERYTMPKLLINATGDQFFLPDSSQFYFDDLPGEKYLEYVPNTDHSMTSNDLFESLLTFFSSLIHDAPRPRFTWEFPADGGIVVTTEDEPLEVTLWQAGNALGRDFRMERIGAAWDSSVLAGAGGVYRAMPEPPVRGWKAYFVALTFPSGGRFPFRFTTAVRVIPNSLPFEGPEPVESLRRAR